MDRYIPRLVSEREPDGTWEDCTWATGVMLANAEAGEDRYPSTRHEYEALRVDGGEVPAEGDGDGSSYFDLAKGLAKRYGLELWSLRSVREIPVGGFAGVQGLYRAVPKALRVTAFLGPHSVFVYRMSPTRFIWLDPLRRSGYEGDEVTLDVVEAFFLGLKGAAILAGWTGMSEWRSMMMLLVNFRRYRASQRMSLYEAPDARSPVVAHVPEGRELTSVGVPMDRTTSDKSPYRATAWRAVFANTRAIDGKVALKVGYVRTDKLVPVPTSAAWDAALVAAFDDPAFRGETVVEVEVPDPETEARLAALRAIAMEVAESLEEASGTLQEGAGA